jgi:hypothetical protein
MTGEMSQRALSELSDKPVCEIRSGCQKLVTTTDAKEKGLGSSAATWAFDAYQDVSTASHTRLKIAIPQISYAKS